MDAPHRLPPGSLSAWCNTAGTAFPHARWCTCASAWVYGAGVALLGDSLHCFPPDLGQGVNAGFCDVTCLLALWPTDSTNPAMMQKCLESYSQQQSPEAEAMCKLLPIGMPYQYALPRSFAKVAFFVGFLVRVLAWKSLPALFYPPVVFQVTQAPPVKYTEILERHHKNTRLFIASLAAASCGILAAVRLCRTKL